ncbi:MAG: ankyrin repeat domain-containing protein, partial [Legionellaceae bacterium]
MAIYYWKGVTGASDLLTEHAQAIQSLLNGTYTQGLEKLKGNFSQPIYSFRLSRGARLLFTTHHDCLHILDFLPNHEYHKSRFLRKGVLGPALEHYDVEVLSEPVIQPQHHIPAQQEQPIGLDFYHQTFIELTETQEGIRQTAALPLILNGVAGSGKTLIALSLLARQYEQLGPNCRMLYVSKEARLVNAVEQTWREGFCSDDDIRVDFRTCNSLAGLPSNAQAEEAFAEWFHGLKINPLIPFEKASEFEQEFMSGCSGLSREDYCALGARQSAIPPDPAMRHACYDAYESYLATLQDKVVDSRFSSLLAYEDQTYDLVVVDETQNLSLKQIKELIRLAKNQAIVFCMDPHQNLSNAYSIRQGITQQFDIGRIQTINLDLSHRYHPAVRDALNQVLLTKRLIMGGKQDKVEATNLLLAQDKKLGEFTRITPQEFATQPKDWLNERKGHLAIVTSEEFFEEAKVVFGNNPLIFTPEHIGGQEFHTVIVYKFLSSRSSIQILKQLFPLLNSPREEASPTNRAKHGKLDARYINWINACFTACSRAQYALIMIEENNRYTLPFLSDFDRLSLKTAPEKLILPSINWDKMAEKQDLYGNTHIAQAIRKEQTHQPKPTQTLTQAAPNYDTQAFTDLLKSVESGNLKRIRKLLKKENIDINQVFDNKTLLHLAVQTNNADVLGLLLSYPTIDPNQVVSGGRTALMIAVGLGYLEMVKGLLQHKDINPGKRTTEGSGALALMPALVTGHREICNLLLPYHGVNCYLETQYYQTPLMIAATFGHLELINDLLRRPELLPNLINANGENALRIAITNDNHSAVEALLSDERVKSSIISAQDALVIAARIGNIQTIRLLLAATDIDVNNTLSVLRFINMPKMFLLTPLLVAMATHKTDAVLEFL